MNLQAGDNVQYVHAARVSAHYLRCAGHSPGFRAQLFRGGRPAPRPKAAILSYDLWRTTFGANRDLVGQTIHLKGEPYTVIGVLPAGSNDAGATPIFTPHCNPAARAKAAAPILK